MVPCSTCKTPTESYFENRKKTCFDCKMKVKRHHSKMQNIRRKIMKDND